MKPAGVAGSESITPRPLVAAGRRRSRSVDREAVAAVVATHRQMVYGFLRARLTDAAAAEDLCQEVFLRFLTSRPVVATGSGEVSAWLAGIARNVLREHVRRAARRREVAWTELCLQVEDRAAAAPDDRADHLTACLDGLGKTARTALDLHYGENLRLAEIGRRFDRSEGAVKLLLFRARQAVRRCLDAGRPVAEEADDA
ncbi:MAG: RNA polymerase sigma factor [Planctomycetia bacterium]